MNALYRGMQDGLSATQQVEVTSHQPSNSSQKREDISEIGSGTLKRSRDDQSPNPRPLKKMTVEKSSVKLGKSEGPEKGTDNDLQSQGSEKQIALQEEKVKIARQKYQNLVALSGYTSVDKENVANGIYNDARNSRLYGSNAIAYMEKELSKRYGIPIGTITDSLENAYQGHNRDDYISNVIQNALTEQQFNGSLERFKQDLEQAEMFLQYLREPSNAPNDFVLQTNPQSSAQPLQGDAILEMINDSENVARAAGFPDNIYVQARYLATRLAGADSGDQYEQIYSNYYDAIQKWRQAGPKDKPTQYGFLTLVTDLMINGTSTAPVETKHQSWFDKFIQKVGPIGIGFQIDGSNLQVGTLSNPNLVTVYSWDSPSVSNGILTPSFGEGSTHPTSTSSESSNSKLPSQETPTSSLPTTSSQKNETASSADSSNSISQKQQPSQGNISSSNPTSENQSHSLPNVDQGTNQSTIGNLIDGFSLAGTVQEQLIGHSSLGLVGTALGGMNEIQENGLWGVWNTGVDLLTDHALSKIPGAGTAVTLSNLYNHNLPEDQACNLQKEFYEETKNQNAVESNVFTKEIEYEAGQAYLECKVADSQLRGPSKLVENVQETLHMH